MKGFIPILLLSSFLSLNTVAKEFLYPVGYHPTRQVVFVIYQKTVNHLELWEWNPHTRYAHQLLLSRYSPAAFTFLPDYSGFSFIDNGILKVKQLVKRSPRTIEYDSPIYNVEQVNWIDTKSCYAAGKYQDYFGIFHIDWDGIVQPLLFKEGVDYQYPQKIGNTLFFIERVEESYKVGSVDYSVDFNEDSFEYKVSAMQSKHTQEIIDFGSSPIAFLQMVSDSEGYVVSFPKVVSKKSEKIKFSYYKLTKKEGRWGSFLLFSFMIPTSFLIRGHERLFESILPLLPVPDISSNEIYYVDSSDTPFLSFYNYNEGTAEKRIITQDHHHFGIKETKFGWVYGGEMGGIIDMTEGVQIDLGLFLGS